ncbi:MAG: nickel pincer cofactor biosynthesis protein LarC [Verrucomicrobiota bacterium]
MKKKTLHFESIGGASGDMILGALVGLGVSADELNEELKSLKVDPFEIIADEVVEQGMSGIRARVEVHEHHHHDHGHHHGRHLSTILKLIDESELPDPVKIRASAVFQRIGEAEAAIHGVDIEKIHFHEVGAMDSIVDIVGCCLALHKLGADEVSIRSLPQGHGTIECAHGTYPNPAPATLRLLEGFPVEEVDEPFELVTPTGAALLSSWRTAETPITGSRAVKTAYSFGHRKLNGRPNLLRASLYEVAEDDAEDEAAVWPGHSPRDLGSRLHGVGEGDRVEGCVGRGPRPRLSEDEVLVLECNLDDTTPELVGCLFDQLLEAGALDVFTTPVFMKKQRPGILLTVLCAPSDREKTLDLIFLESTTFGVRERMERRTILERSFQTVETPFGDVRIKIGRRNGKAVTTSPEFEDCRKFAAESGVPVRNVYDAALSIFNAGKANAG